MTYSSTSLSATSLSTTSLSTNSFTTTTRLLLVLKWKKTERIVSKICVTAAGSFMVHPSVFPVIPAESGIASLCTGSARPYLVVNRILICSGGLGLPHQQGWGSCFGALSTLFSGATVFTTITKHEKAVGTVRRPAQCRVHCASDATTKW